MDEYGQDRVDPGSEFHTGTYEYGTVDPGKEFSLPRLESEFSKECGKEPEAKEKRQRGETIKRIIRYTATAALSLGLLVEATPAAPVEPEPEEVESMVLITCAAVRPEEPDLLYYDWNLTDWTVLGGPSGRIEDVFLYIVDPNGQETEPLESVQAPCNRYGYMPEQNGSDFFSYKLFTGEEAGLRQPDPGWKSYGNLSIMLSAERIEPYCEGSSLKIVVLFETEGVRKKMTSVRQIDLLPPTADVSVSLETTPQGNGISHARMRAVFHPQNGDEKPQKRDCGYK